MLHNKKNDKIWPESLQTSYQLHKLVLCYYFFSAGIEVLSFIVYGFLVFLCKKIAFYIFVSLTDCVLSSG